MNLQSSPTIKNLLGILWLLVICACTSKKEIYEGEYNGEKVTVWDITEKSILNNYYWQRLKVGSLHPIDLNYKNTSNGIPYDTAMYAGVPHYYIDSGVTHYINRYDTASNKQVMLYFSPKRGFSKQEFESYAELFKKEWKNIESKIELKQDYHTIKIAGIVYGEDKNFVHTFFKGKPGKDYNAIEVQTDGGIYFNTFADIEATQSTNLSDKVQMPGRIVYLKKEGGKLTADSLRILKDQKGKTIYDYFNVKEEK